MVRLSIEMNAKTEEFLGNLIEFREVSFHINDIPTRSILSGISLAVSHGETLVLLGRSGSGKTTLLRLMNGMLFPTQGEVLVQQRSTCDWDLIRLRRGIGYVIQEAGLLPPIPGFGSWTSHSARSIPSRAPSCSVNSAPSPAASAKPSSSSLTTCAKLCCSLRVSSCSKLAASWPWLRLRNFSVSSIPKFAPLLLLWKPLPEPPHEPRPEQLVLLRRAPRGNLQRHTRSYGSCRHRHDHRYSHWCPAEI